MARPIGMGPGSVRRQLRPGTGSKSLPRGMFLSEGDGAWARSRWADSLSWWRLTPTLGERSLGVAVGLLRGGAGQDEHCCGLMASKQEAKGLG